MPVEPEKKSKRRIKFYLVIVVISAVFFGLINTEHFEAGFQEHIFPVLRQARENKTRLDLQFIQKELMLDFAENGYYPEDLGVFLYQKSRLRNASGEIPVDGWGNSYLIVGNEGIRIIKSAGNDKKYYTQDDMDIKL